MNRGPHLRDDPSHLPVGFNFHNFQPTTTMKPITRNHLPRFPRRDPNGSYSGGETPQCREDVDDSIQVFLLEGKRPPGEANSCHPSYSYRQPSPPRAQKTPQDGTRDGSGVSVGAQTAAPTLPSSPPHLPLLVRSCGTQHPPGASAPASRSHQG
ncbi:hypothetical protein NHX12_023167 [Muraenolepis orangiensis]|uniref:Uncharacterized protein n=1 Tax=Muraenolepis orangiensis TaxID=630683 RepID=A0A9Q0ISI1_9TELE|nr:hypothetical protein NHX12_023167 [Muraenolepis orangiensis]